jgi:hypothetical protein
MQRDDQGNLIVERTNEIEFKQHPSGYATFFEDVFLFTDDGTIIMVWENLGEGNHKFDTNCHGYTFADGEFWIEPNQVDSILCGDNYENVDSPQVGDIVIYRDKTGEAVHSAKVVSVSDTSVEVEGISGIRDTMAVRTNVEDAWPRPSTFSYYRQE